jgi:Nuclease-related domain
MILKSIDLGNANHPMTKAGRAAEEQMAHYLKRAFSEEPSILVLNSLRLERAGEVAQIDHLVLHRFGLVIVESKSISGEVRVNALGEWLRRSGNQAQGMASPVLQAKRQSEFLFGLLSEEGVHLLDKMLGLVQKRYGAMPREVLVAISDQGMIGRADPLALPEVCKADQVPDKIRAIIAARKKSSNFFFGDVNDVGYTLSDAELARIAAFLLGRHRPNRQAGSAQGSAPVSSVAVDTTAGPLQASSRPAPQPPVPIKAVESKAVAAKSRDDQLSSVVCRHCSSPRVNIMYGKFGYYFKCGACDGNTPIQMTCPSCKAKAKVRKNKERFFFECAGCGSSTLFFVNVGEVVVTG